MNDISLSKIEKKKILREIEKLLYTYNLNRVIRYDQKRTEKFETQSVAEHVTNSLFLAHYFIDIEDKKHRLDFAKIIRMIIMHDMGEIEKGDVILMKKTKKDTKKELKSLKKVAIKSPDFVQKEINYLCKEFETRTNKEAQFAYSIDKIEGQLFWCSNNGVNMMRDLFTRHNLKIETAIMAYEKTMPLLLEYGFKEMSKFFKVIHDEKIRLGLYKKL